MNMLKTVGVTLGILHYSEVKMEYLFVFMGIFKSNTDQTKVVT